MPIFNEAWYEIHAECSRDLCHSGPQNSNKSPHTIACDRRVAEVGLDFAFVERDEVEDFFRGDEAGRKDDDYWRDLQLEGLGWKVCRFSVYELREDLPRCVARVVGLLRGEG